MRHFVRRKANIASYILTADWGIGAILPLGFCMTSLTFISRRENVCYQLHVIAFAIMQKTICNYANDIQKASYLFDCRPAMKSTALFRMIPTETKLKSIFILYFNLASFPLFASLVNLYFHLCFSPN